MKQEAPILAFIIVATAFATWFVLNYLTNQLIDMVN
jgi:hypothetical protein